MSIQSIIPILLTILSTALGLIPFLLDGPDEQPFWYSLAMATIEGLLVSVIAIVLVMPVFLNLSTQKHTCYRCHNNCHNSDSLLPTQHQDTTGNTATYIEQRSGIVLRYISGGNTLIF